MRRPAADGYAGRVTDQERPIDRAREIAQRTLGWFPLRVWRHFLQHNGFLLAAGVSYQALFSMFALLYVTFAGVGVWLGGSDEAIAGLIGIINSYAPGLITETSSGSTGLFTVDQVAEIAKSSTGVLAVTGAIALLTALWTSVGFITFARKAVRDIFVIPPDDRGFLRLKARDFVASLAFAVLLAIGSVLATASSTVLNFIFELLGWSDRSPWYRFGVGLGALLVGFVVFTVAIGALMRFLIGISLSMRRVLPGAMIGGAAITVLQFGVGYLLSFTPSNPLLATFAVFVGLLLWFRLLGIIVLVASSWVAVAAHDDHERLIPLTDEEILARRRDTELEAARERLRLAVEARSDAPWWRSRGPRQEVQDALTELERLEERWDAARSSAAGDVPPPQ